MATLKNNTFRFKQFSVVQERAAMKVGTDGVLLGAWVSLSSEVPVRRILDIGTGTGVIALMLAQRTAFDAERTVVEAVEVDEAAVDEAAANFQASEWNPRLSVFGVPAQEYAGGYAGEKYDLIVSNPPYFMAGTDFRRGFDTSASPPSRARMEARHAEALPYDELIDAVLLLLNPDGGRFAAIFPYRESSVFIAKAAARGLYARRILEVRGAAHKPVKRVAAEFSPERCPKEHIVRETLSIEAQHGEFTEEYRALTRDFYLKF